jgi:hypothetical protein
MSCLVFRLKQSTSLHLARLLERMARNFGEKRLKIAVSLYEAKAFDTSGSMASSTT